MNLLTRTLEEVHFHLPKIVLAELPRETLEPHHRFGGPGTQRRYQPVERGLAALIARLSHPPQNLQCGQIRLLLQNPNHLFPEIANHAGSADLSLGSFRDIIDM
jgi:hypothetical protein